MVSEWLKPIRVDYKLVISKNLKIHKTRFIINIKGKF